MAIGARDIWGDPRGRVGRVPDELQGVPMLDGFSIVVEPVYINTRDARFRRVVGQKIQEVHMREHVVADGDDLVDHYAGPLMLPSDLSEVLPQGHGSIGDQRIVLVADGAAVVGVYEYEHRKRLNAWVR
jgi:hypothetical protein